MQVLHSPSHRAHAPAFEFFRGERVPCFETPVRAEFVRQALQARGHELVAPQDDSSALLPRVHHPGYLAFLQSAWKQWLALDPANAERQPFPSVWPVRSLRSDVEPDNFIARLGLYSMDNGSPLSAGTWVAAKAGADAAASAANLGPDDELHIVENGRFALLPGVNHFVMPFSREVFDTLRGWFGDLPSSG